MERLHYAGGTLVTGSAIAHSLLAYAQALASRSASATVSIPVRLEDGSTGSAEILIGPASQLLAEPYESGPLELEDAEVVTSLDLATAALQVPRPVAEKASEFSATDVSDLELPADGLV